MAREESLRLQAVMLHDAGMGVSAISSRLCRSRQWVYKWVGRSSLGGDWSKSLSHAPHRSVNKISSEMESLIVSTRLELESSPHMESGAYAIWHAVSALGKEPPSIATINRILKRHSLVKSKIRYAKSGIEYYLLTIISNDTRYAGVYPIVDKSALEVTRSVVSFWKQYSVPDFLQLDNELSFKGSNRHPRGLGLLLRTALSFNVIPRFIPVGEPWRNGVVERFNQKVERTLLLQTHNDFDELALHCSEFMTTHNTLHHYSTLGHKTPSEINGDLNTPLSPLAEDYVVCGKPALDYMNINEIHFIRLIRSDLTVNILNTELKVSPSLAHTYVEAVLLVNEHRLLIRQDGKTVQDFWFVMPVI